MSRYLSWPVLWSVMTWAWLASEIFIALRTRTRHASGRVRDRGSMLVLWVVIGSSITAVEWIRNVSAPTMPGGSSLKIAGVLLLALGLSIRWASVLSLGRAFSANVAVREGQALRRTGLYRMVRHPSYLGLLLIFLAIGLHARNWAALAIAVLPTIAALLYRIHIEEAALRDGFGEEYLAYSRTTRRLIPGLY
jgi:protein-S-isoprenylcysteine O-methyltransferase